MQRLRDAEREILFEEFIDKEEDILELLTVLTIVMYM